MLERDEPDMLAGALANWREWMADGRAEHHGPVLYITGPEMTRDEWEAGFVTEH